MVKLFRVIFVLILFVFGTSRAQNISVSASTDTTVYKVGDFIRFTLEMRYDKSIKVELPPIKDSIKVLEFIQRLPSEKSEVDSKIIEKHTFLFSKYDSAEVIIPSLKVYYSSIADTSKKFLETIPITIVVSTLPVDMQKDITDIKAPIKIPLPWWIILLIIVGAAALIIGAYFIYNYIKKKKSSKVITVPEIIVPPHETALAELSELKSKKLWQSGAIKEYHSEITGIVRKYFENRFQFRALEMTSAEILGVLSFIEEGKPVVDTSNNFFTNADLVKFAKFEPMPQINEDMMSQAFEIVNKTIPVTVTETEKQ